MVKLDFSNAFNSLRRDAMLKAVADKVPDLYAFCHAAYSCNSVLKFGSHSVLSSEGVQQGDPLGPLLFCLTLQPALQSLSSPLEIGYLDDVTLGGPVDVVSRDVQTMTSLGDSIGLILNSAKCEVISSTPVADKLLYK